MSVDETRERLIQAAEEVFAREGVHRAQVREITQRAGQRNSSALHYHFGSTEGVVLEIVRRHQEVIETRRAELLAALPASVPVDAVVEAICLPLAERLDDPSGRNYLCMLPTIIAEYAWRQFDTIVFTAPGLERCHALLAEAMPGLERALLDERFRSMVLALTTLLAARATLLNDGAANLLDRVTFVENLVAMMTGLMRAGQG